MYDVLRGRYTFACPAHDHVSVPLSAFRQLGRLPGAAHPAVYHVRFACLCGGEHDGLVAHDDLDWAPLGVGEESGFVNLMTDRLEPVHEELRDLAARRIRSGSWPWAMFCYPEGRPRPAFPSLFQVIAPRGKDDHVGIVARCSSCGKLSVNVVSTAHVDVPFCHDAEVGVLGHVLPDDVLQTVDAFRAELSSATFEPRRLAP